MSNKEIMFNMADGITFRHLQPGEPGGSEVHTMFDQMGRGAFEIENALFEEKEYYASLFREIADVPRMSTFAIGSLINKAASLVKSDGCYLNIGLWHGFTLLAGKLGHPEVKCIGVDNFSQFGGPREECLKRLAWHGNVQIYDQDYEEFFAQSFDGTPIDFYYYDGDHTKYHQKNALELAAPYLRVGSVVFVDDINVSDLLESSLEFLDRGDFEYEKFFCLGNGHPTWWNGLLIAVKVR